MNLPVMNVNKNKNKKCKQTHANNCLQKRNSEQNRTQDKFERRLHLLLDRIFFHCEPSSSSCDVYCPLLIPVHELLTGAIQTFSLGRASRNLNEKRFLIAALIRMALSRQFCAASSVFLVHCSAPPRNRIEYREVHDESELEAAMDGDAPPHDQHPDVVNNNHIFSPLTFIQTFFSSLIPEPPPPVNIN
ncbi:ubiquitin-like domain-containing protein [Caerostris darwini]|uniref:Ubiquitin-like domain-containing protein n=1 Tax=Caerostris darwini TaxID=1538125 RepID=A0AAV4TEZ0_9ARAC|nr:ubiquitin-like domain-containing protein [Caerostris darwini]